MATGVLYLIPTVIADGTHEEVLAPHVRQVLPSIQYFLAEEVRTARRFLSALKIFPSIEALHFETLNKDTPDSAVPALIQPLLNGQNMGVLSESGCPGVADPGSKVVALAHQKNIHVVPLVGPSSILLALIGSGLNGQQFCFHGYLPIDSKELTIRIKELERESKVRKQTQIFIETPFRNQNLLEQLTKTLQPETLLTVAYSLTSPNESIHTKKVSQWRHEQRTLAKEPAVFLFLA